MSSPVIDILLATYNGTRFIDDQLQSLLEQDFQDWRLIVRDDGSSDGTIDLVRRFADRVDQPVIIIEDGDKGLGASRNFGRILERSTAPYFAFCDQDDLWLPNKLSASLSAIRTVEGQASATLPVLAHCDLEVVDSDLTTISKSFRNFAGLRRPPAGEEARHLMLQNFVTGCALMGNAELRRLSTPIPNDAMMHDWWLALIATGIGRIIEIPDALIRYRQHGSNTLGAKSARLLSNAVRVISGPTRELARGREIIFRTRIQATEFATRFGGVADPEMIALYKAYAATEHQSLMSRKTFVLKNRIFSQDVLRIAALLLVI